MMTIENIHGRETLKNLIDFKFPLSAIIIEHKSKLAENARDYLKNDFYNPPSFKELIDGKKIPVHFVENHNDEDTKNFLKKYSPDYIILGNTRILKEHIISTAKKGVLNSHPAILPQYRGLDCVGWSILNRDSVGATVHMVDPGIDSGPIIIQEIINFDDCNSLLAVRVKVMRKCAILFLKSLIGLEFGTLYPKIQESSLAKKYPSLPLEKINIVEEKISKQFDSKNSLK